MAQQIIFPRAHECAFIIKDKTYCLKPVENILKPYCPEHILIMYRPRSTRDMLAAPNPATAPAIKRAKTKVLNEIKKREKGKTK